MATTRNTEKHSELINKLEKRLSGPLPGPEAQYKMAHAVRRDPGSPPPDALLAAVLALLYPRHDHWHIVLIERQSHNPRDRHKGQISLPGGRFEEDDRLPVITALRETEEEIGIDAGAVRVLGELTELYIPVSNFLVNPFVGFLPYTPAFQPQASEVKDILEVPFDLLLDTSNIRKTDMKISEHITLKEVPYFLLKEKIVWGATAMILSELLEIARE